VGDGYEAVEETEGWVTDEGDWEEEEEQMPDITPLAADEAVRVSRNQLIQTTIGNKKSRPLALKVGDYG
jgi:hypothetical protein